MAERNAVVGVDLIGRLDQLRQQYATVKKEIENDPIRVGFASGSATGAPATFGNAAGSPFTGPAASSRLDQTSVARSSGAALAMQNGAPGALFGGITSMAGQPANATQIVQQNATARMAGGALPAMSFPAPLAGAIPGSPVTAFARPVAGFYGGAGALPAAAASVAGPPSLSQIATLLPQAGTPVAAAAGAARGPQSPWNTAANYLLGAGALVAAGGAVQSVSDAIGVGAMPMGDPRTQYLRSQIGSLQAGRGILQSIPLAGQLLMGASDLVARGLNSMRGRGAVTREEYLGRIAEDATAINEADFEIGETNRRAGRFNNFSSRDAIESTRRGRIRALRYDLYERNGGIYTKGGGGWVLNRRGEAELERGEGAANLDAAEQIRDLNFDLESEIAGVRSEGRIAAARYSRNPYAELRESTIGRLSTLRRNMDPERRDIATQRARQQYVYGSAVLDRAASEAAYDSRAQSDATAMEQNGNTLGADLYRNMAAYVERSRTAYTTELQGANLVQMMIADRGAMIADRRRGIRAATSGYVAGRISANDPLGAQVGGIAGQFAIATKGMSRSEVGYQRAQGEAVAGISTALYERDTARGGVGIDQRFESLSINRSYARDLYGSRAYSIAGASVGRAFQLERAGMTTEATEERRLGQRRLGLEKQDYLDAFRGQEANPYATAFDGPRDRENIRETLAQFSNANRMIGESNGSGGFGSGGYSGPSKEDLQKMLEDAVGKIVDSINN